MLELGEIRRLAEGLSGTRSGGWLSGALTKHRESEGHPGVLTVVSSRREVDRVFPLGLRLDVQVAELARGSSTDATVDEVRRCEVLLWAMTARKMFSAEYAEVLEIARKGRVPIWAVVVGLERASAPERFRTDVVPQQRGRLPQGSEIVLVATGEGEQALKALNGLLVQKGQMLASAGDARRRQWLVDATGEHLARERNDLNASLSAATRRLETAHAVVQALMVMAQADASAIGQTYADVGRSAQDLQRRLSTVLDVDGGTLSSEELERKVSALLDEWRKKSLRPRLADARDAARAHLREWAARANAELASLSVATPEGRTPAGGRHPIGVDAASLDSRLASVLDGLETASDDALEALRSVLKNDVLLQVLRVLGRPVNVRPGGKQDGHLAERSRGRQLAPRASVVELRRRQAELQHLASVLEQECQRFERTLRKQASERAPVILDILRDAVTRAGQVPIGVLADQVPPIQAKLDTVLRAEREVAAWH